VNGGGEDHEVAVRITYVGGARAVTLWMMKDDWFIGIKSRYSNTSNFNVSKSTRQEGEGLGAHGTNL
jgi:hypothetical protein